jgi:predicted Na+-dependent transporter
MQNSALAVVLSRHFPHPDLTALPGALSATCHSVIGSLLASFWRRSRPSGHTQPQTYVSSNNDKGVEDEDKKFVG